MTDQITGEVEAFNNVLILQADIYENYIYPEATFQCGGTGYYACGGKIIPIIWECERSRNPFRFMTLDGEPLNVNVGNTYMGIIGQPKERVEWKEVIPPPTEPPVETTVATEPETVPTETAAATVPETVPTETTVETTTATTAAAVSETTAETVSKIG